jgi:signal transduction histidine kinase
VHWFYHPVSGRNWLYFALRWVFLIGFTLAIFFQRLGNNPPVLPELSSLLDVGAAFVIGALATLLLLPVYLIPRLRPYTAFIQIPGDGIIAFLFSYLAATNASIIGGVGLLLLLNGILRLGVIEGLLQALVVIAAALAGLLVTPGMRVSALADYPALFGPFILFLLIGAAALALWSNVLERTSSIAWREMEDEATRVADRLAKIQESTRAFASMAARLNSSLEYDKVLETALDIGRRNLRHTARQRAVALAVMVETDTTLEIAVSQGLSSSDFNHTFEGRDDSIIGRVMHEGEVEIMGRAYDDPELAMVTSFRGIESVLCVPLRADYTTYGVLLFGSENRNAFTSDNLDLLKSLGVQVTVALKNAVLYSSLQEEKQRMAELDRNVRYNLARDLHDTVTQTVAAIKTRLQLVPRLAERNREELGHLVAEMSDITGRAVEEMRHVMFALRPLVLESQGLAAALMELKDKLERTYKQKVTADVDFTLEPLLKIEQKEMLFYLVEEATTNIRKYAEATQSSIKLSHENTNVVIRISDNGKGFDARAMKRGKNGSYGMVNMQQRAELSGGSIQIDSAPGKGTRITVKVPVGVEAPSPNGSGNIILERRRMKREYSGPSSPLS